MMHYFLAMEVWKNVDGISMGQGMMDRKAMTTPMASNLKFLSDASSRSVDAMMYRQMIGSLMYLTNTRLNICCEHIETCSPDGCKACSEVPKGYR